MIEYDPHDWRQHFFDVRGSMVRQIIYRVLLCFLVAAGVTYAHHEHVDLAISEKGHALVGVALGLLLVFRTNASYDRFWEGRKQWGAIVNETRNLARATSVMVAADPALVARILRWTVAFTWSSMFHLRGKSDLGPGKDELPSEDVARVEAADHPPLSAAREVSRAIDQARRAGVIDAYQQVYLDQNVQLLVDCIGACERIRNTPLPFAYVVHLRRALLIYCLTLPFALLEAFGYGTVVVSTVMAYILLGIEEIGVEIEDPFGVDDNDLPLDAICRTIHRDLRALLPEGTTQTD